MASPFDQLERDLVMAARRRSKPARRPRPAAVAPLTAVFALACAAAAAATSYLAISATGIAPVRDSALTPEQRVTPGSAQLLDLRAADPEHGEPPWGMRLSRSQTGLLCGIVGQVKDATLGLVGLDGRFRSLPDANADACGEQIAGGVSLLGARIFDAKRYRDVRTVISGVAGPDLERVAISIRGRAPRLVAHSREGAFVLAARGYPEDLAPRVSLTWRGGRARTVTLATSPNVRIDPLGGPAWRVSGFSGGGVHVVRSEDGTVRRYPQILCAQFAAAHQSDAMASSPAVCGKAGFGGTRTRFYATRRLAGDRAADHARWTRGGLDDHRCLPPRRRARHAAHAARRPHARTFATWSCHSRGVRRGFQRRVDRRNRAHARRQHPADTSFRRKLRHR
jgi:hypothetical protein